MTQEQRDQILLDIRDEQRKTNKRLDRLEQRMDKLEQRVGNLEKRMDSMEKRMDSMEKRMDSMEKRMDNMEEKIGYMEPEFKGMRKDIGEIKYLLYEWEPVLDYAQQYVTSHEGKINSLTKQVKSNTQCLKSVGKIIISTLDSNKVANQ